MSQPRTETRFQSFHSSRGKFDIFILSFQMIFQFYMSVYLYWPDEFLQVKCVTYFSVFMAFGYTPE